MLIVKEHVTSVITAKDLLKNYSGELIVLHGPLDSDIALLIKFKPDDYRYLSLTCGGTSGTCLPGGRTREEAVHMMVDHNEMDLHSFKNIFEFSEWIAKNSP